MKPALAFSMPCLVLGMIWSSISFGQITPSADSYTNTANPTTNYGAAMLLDVNGAAQITYIQFPFSSIPAGAMVSQATLKLYVNSVTAAGSFNVDYVNGAWSESTIDSHNAPPLGSTIASNVSITTADKNQYILINVTPAVQAWLSGSETNNGLALVANSTFNATFDSKENTTTSHPAELDIAFAAIGSTGSQNTAVGAYALYHNSSGGQNTAVGNEALFFNTVGGNNTAVGLLALGNNTTGTDNVATGTFALGETTTGGNNSAYGFGAGEPADGSKMSGSYNTFLGNLAMPSTGTLSNVTAIGNNAQVAESNALVLGSIYGVGQSPYADTSVGIGTTTPVSSGLPDGSATKLNIVGNNTYVPLVVQSPSTFGTWMLLTNTSTGGRQWAILSTASGNGEGAGNLGITDFGNGGTILLESNVQVAGTLSKAGGSFKIDHPLDPENKYLYHSFVESPDMMNIYNGVVTLDSGGSAWITMPDYFEALNRDFRYQLTSIGRPQPNLYIAWEVTDNRFQIAGGAPGGRVSWQVTGVRHDAYANAHRIQVEEDKPPQEQGHYLHPELFGAAPEKAIGYWPTASRQANRQQIAEGSHP